MTSEEIAEQLRTSLLDIVELVKDGKLKSVGLNKFDKKDVEAFLSNLDLRKTIKKKLFDLIDSSDKIQRPPKCRHKKCHINEVMNEILLNLLNSGRILKLDKNLPIDHESVREYILNESNGFIHKSITKEKYPNKNFSFIYRYDIYFLEELIAIVIVDKNGITKMKWVGK